MPPRTRTLAENLDAISLDDDESKSKNKDNNDKKKKRKKNKYPMLGPKKKRRKRRCCPELGKKHEKVPLPLPPTNPPSPPELPEEPNSIKPEPSSESDSLEQQLLQLELATSYGISAQEHEASSGLSEPEPKLLGPELEPARTEPELGPESMMTSGSGPGGGTGRRGLTLDQLPYDILYLIIEELCKPIPLRSDILHDQLAPSKRQGGYVGRGEIYRAIRQLRKLPLVCKAFYDPAMANIYKYIPFSFHTLNSKNWSSLAEFWNRQENRPVTGRIRRLHIVFNPEGLDRWNFDSRYADEPDVKNHLDGIRRLNKILMSSLTDLSELEELDISIVGRHEAVGTSTSEMKPSWYLLTSLKNALTNRFDNLTTLGLKAPACDLASLLQSVSSELCANLRSFYCTLSGCNIGGGFKPDEDPTDTINAFVKRCPNLRSLSLPYLSRGLRLHPDNTGLKELIVFEGPWNHTNSYLKNLYLELIPVLMSKGAAQVELWYEGKACKLLENYLPLLDQARSYFPVIY
ncbi:hypothetical protein B0H65DRAFT_186409 [Neurospora tetraspora]|uniref:F-box domain-containing protein n=1 Tax=Neurospora tetraspora TaxID=94610 RepID=A0AAE0MSN6_9PEZI|nr:hypothetical protein B0H65DRAFT_186409 [Neurospora tetraspora]